MKNIFRNKKIKYFIGGFLILFFLTFFNFSLSRVEADFLHKVFNNDGPALYGGDSIWEGNDADGYLTKEPVSIDKEYYLREGVEFFVKFERLEKPQAIKVKEHELNNKLRFYGYKFYEITTDMPDSSFEYSLRLPFRDLDNDDKTDDKNAFDLDQLKIYFQEGEPGGDFSKDDFSMIKSVDYNINLNKDQNFIEVSGLDHFTGFLVAPEIDWNVWEEGYCLTTKEETNEKNGVCYDSMDQALNEASPFDLIDYGIDESMVVLDYAYEKSETNDNEGGLDKEKQCGFDTNSRIKREDGFIQEVVEFTHVPHADEYRILTLIEEGDSFVPLTGQEIDNEDTWFKIPAKNQQFGANAFTEIDDNDTVDDLSDDIFRYVSFTLNNEGVYTNKIVAYRNGLKIGETKLDQENWENNCTYSLDVTAPYVKEASMLDGSRNFTSQVVDNEEVFFRVEAEDGLSEIEEPVKVKIYEYNTDNQIGEIELNKESDGIYEAKQNIGTLGVDFATWKVLITDSAGNSDKEAFSNNFSVNPAGDTIASPVVSGLNVEGMADSINQSPYNYDFSLEEIFINKNYVGLNWSSIANARYIVGVKTPDHVKYVLGGGKKYYLTDLDNLADIRDNLDDSFENEYFSNWSLLEDGRGEYTFYVRAFYDINEANGKYDEGEPVSDWSLGAKVYYDEQEPFVDAGPNQVTDSAFDQDAEVVESFSGIDYYRWYKVSGPGTVIFATPNEEDTRIEATQKGQYVIALEVKDLAGNVSLDEISLDWSSDSDKDKVEMGFESGDEGGDNIGICNLNTNDVSYNPPYNDQAEWKIKFSDIEFASKYVGREFIWDGSQWKDYGIDTVLVDKSKDYTHSRVTFDESQNIWQLETGAVSNNIFTYYIEAYDAAGNLIASNSFNPRENRTNKAEACKFVADAYAPYVNVGEDFSSDGEFLIDAHTVDSHSGIDSYEWTLIDGPGLVFFGSADQEDTTVTADMNGDYTLRLTVYDKAGNSAYDELVFNWDTTPPEVTVDKLVTNDTTPRLTGKIDKVTAKVTIIVNEKEYSAVNKGDGSWVLEDNMVEELENGIYDVTAKAEGLSGNLGVDGTLGELIVDVVPPEVEAGTSKYGLQIFQQNATVVDLDSGIAGYQWSKISGPGNVNFSSAMTEDTMISTDAQGTYVLRLTAVDLAGNSAYDEMVVYWEDVVGFTKEPLLEINQGDYKTDDRKVKLDLYPFNSKTVAMMISNESDFEHADWEDFASSKEWNLSGDRNDLKAVYVKFKDSDGSISGIAVNHIYLEKEDEDEEKDEGEDENNYDYQSDYSGSDSAADIVSVDSASQEEEESEEADDINIDDLIESIEDEDTDEAREEEEAEEEQEEQEEQDLEEDDGMSGMQVYEPKSIVASVLWPNSLLGKLFVLLTVGTTIVLIYLITRKMAEREED
ncbi:MAG: hypothetical protein GF347_00290 [Candidatus Moranbacteria bacterium]|nr:hypothetical protein [Candidatus Moranbacteria bacterium]